MIDIEPTRPQSKFIPIEPEVIIFKLYAIELYCPNGLKAQFFGEMTHDEMPFIDLSIGRHFVPAYRLRISAAGMKIAPRGRVQRRRHITLEPDSTFLVMRIWHRKFGH